VRVVKGLLGAVGVLAVAGASVAFTGVFAPDSTKDRPVNSRLPPATERVERGDLSETTQLDGTLGFARERKLNSGDTGMVTWTAPAGSTVRRGGKLYEVNGVPVRLMYGSRPMYRTLKPGDEGPDVRQVEKNLAALGYTGFTVDDEYTEVTASTVKQWQEDHDLKETGLLGPDRVVFAPGAVRIKSADQAAGDQTGPGQPVLTTTGTEHVVTFQLDVTQGEQVKVGAKVSVTLPDGTDAVGRISAVGRTATVNDQDNGTAKIKISVGFDHPNKIKGVDQAPVTVNLRARTHKNVLSVPVGALLARPGGGFAIQVVENGVVRELKVELGLYAQGRVEVTAVGLRAGMSVGVPKI